MGYSRWDADSWSSYSSTVKSKPASKIFTRSSMDDDLNPLNITMRESRDSDANPESTAIIVASDVTGSMGMIAEELIKNGLGILFEEILERKPVTDPHVMAMAIGDATMWDNAPLQVSQFEADMAITEQLERIYVEGGGGGNNFESYDLPYYFAAQHTSIDCFEKRNKKGYIFTIGDEMPPPATEVNAVKDFIGDDIQQDIPFKEVLNMASKMYNTYHIIVGEGWFARSREDDVKNAWREIMGQNVVWLDDYTKLAEVIVSIIEVTEGSDKATVTKSWSGDTSLVVANAIKDLDVSSDSSDNTGIVRL